MSRSTTLGELLTATGGSIKTGPFGTTLKASEYSSLGVPLISVGEVGYGAIRLTAKTPRVGTQVTNRLPEYILRHGDLVFGRKGAVDRSAWVREHEDGYFLGSDGIRVRFGSNTDSRFMAYQLQSPDAREWLLQHASGTTMLSLNQEILDRVPIVVPEYGTQQAIAEVLGALDDKIAANDSACDLADQLCASEVRKAASSGVSTVLRDVLVLKYGKALPASGRTPGDVTVYGSGGPTGTHDTPLVDRQGVIVGRKGTVGAVYWADGPHFPIDTTYFVEAIQSGLDEILYYVLRSMPLGELNSDSAVPGLNREEAYSQQVLMPGSDASVALGQMLRHRFAWMGSVRAESRRLAATRDELLPLLMSGKVRVRDAEKVVEEVV